MSFLNLIIFNPLSFFLIDLCLHSAFFTLTLILIITTALLALYHITLLLASALISLCQLARILRTRSPHADSLAQPVDPVQGAPAHLPDTGPVYPVQGAPADTGPVDLIQDDPADTGSVDPAQDDPADQADTGCVDPVHPGPLDSAHIDPAGLVHGSVVDPVRHELVVREEVKEVGKRRRTRRQRIRQWLRKAYLCEYGFEHDHD